MSCIKKVSKHFCSVFWTRVVTHWRMLRRHHLIVSLDSKVSIESTGFVDSIDVKDSIGSMFVPHKEIANGYTTHKRARANKRTDGGGGIRKMTLLIIKVTCLLKHVTFDLNSDMCDQTSQMLDQTSHMSDLKKHIVDQQSHICYQTRTAKLRVSGVKLYRRQLECYLVHK